MVTLESSVVPHVLLAERIDLLRLGAAKILRGLGCAVWSAGDGDEALDLARVIPGGLDLMVLDTYLPGMDGLSVAHSLRSRWPRAGAILLAHAEIARPSWQLGLPLPCAVLETPVSPALLASVAQRLIGAGQSPVTENRQGLAEPVAADYEPETNAATRRH